MSAVFCADCGTGCAALYGREVDSQERDIADVQVWSCPVCPCSWSREGGAPAGPETRDARRQVAERIIAWAADHAPAAEHALAASRVDRYLGAHLGIGATDGTVGHLDLHQCRQAWRILRALDYAEVRRWSTQKQPAEFSVEVTEGCLAVPSAAGDAARERKTA